TVISQFRCPQANIPLHVFDASTYIPPWFVAKRVPATYIGCVSGTVRDDTGLIYDLDGIMIAKHPPNQWVSTGGMGCCTVSMISDGTSNTIIVGECVPDATNNFTREDPSLNHGRKDHWYIGGDDVDNWAGTDWSECL